MWWTNGALTDPSRPHASSAQLRTVGGADRVDAGSAQRCDLRILQRPVRRAEAQRERQAPPSGAERVTAELVEAADGFEQVTGRGPQRSFNVRRGHGVGEDEGEVDARRREP